MLFNFCLLIYSNNEWLNSCNINFIWSDKWFCNIMVAILDLCKLGIVPGLVFLRTFNMLLYTYFWNKSLWFHIKLLQFVVG